MLLKKALGSRNCARFLLKVWKSSCGSVQIQDSWIIVMERLSMSSGAIGAHMIRKLGLGR